MIVACVLKHGRQYTPKWVHRLWSQVARHLSVPHRFVCLSDQDVPGVECLPLVMDLPSYWSKVELFRPGLFDDRVLFFDLDTLITGSIDRLVEYAGPFAALRDFWAPDIQASGVMAWDGRNPPPIHEAFADCLPERVRHGARFDRWWNQYATAEVLQDLYPGMIGSYKEHGLEHGPREFAVCAFHGKPGPHELPSGSWAARHWRGA